MKRHFWQINENSKLIVITRDDLIPGAQAAQAVHAVIEFVYEHPQVAKDWYNFSKYLVLLSVKNQNELLELVNKLDQRSISYSKFYEPDLGNELTAITLEPSKESRRVVSSLPLMLKNLRKEVTNETN